MLPNCCKVPLLLLLLLLRGAAAAAAAQTRLGYSMTRTLLPCNTQARGEGRRHTNTGMLVSTQSRSELRDRPPEFVQPLILQ